MTFQRTMGRLVCLELKSKGMNAIRESCLKIQKLIIILIFQSMKSEDTTQQSNFNPVLLVQNENNAIISSLSYCNICVFPHYVIYVDNMLNAILIRALDILITHKGREK